MLGIDILQTSERGTVGFSSSSLSMFIPVPWHSGQNAEQICLFAFISSFFPFPLRLPPAFFLDLRFTFGASNCFA